MFCKDYQETYNPDESKKNIATLRPEFIIGSNAVLTREKDVLILKWVDHYSKKQHQALENIFEKLNEQMQKNLPFLGGLKLKFEVAPPRSEKLRNQLRRASVEF